MLIHVHTQTVKHIVKHTHTVTHLQCRTLAQSSILLCVDVWESLGMEGYKCGLAYKEREREREREEWYGLTGVAMGTQLLKAGRVSEEERG